MVLRFFLLASIFFFIFCSAPERDSPCDPDGINYQEPENGEQHILTYVPRFKPFSINALEYESNIFTQDPEITLNTMCAEISSVGTMCGKQLIDNGYVVDFYMINLITKDTVYLSIPRNGNPRLEGCTGAGNSFTCKSTSENTGIIVNDATYKCGGKGKCRGDAEATAKVGIQGSYNVYARLMTKDGKQVEGAEVLLIDSFEGESNSRIIWGKATSDIHGAYDLKDAYGRTATQVQDAVAGKWVPVYISAGNWNDDALTSFEINDEDGPGTAYTLTVSGGSGLTIHSTKGGAQIGSTSASGTIPATGIDTLWVRADYDIGDVEFTLNVAARAPAMTLRIKQPRLEFRESAADNAATVTPSGWAKWGTGSPPKPPVVGNALDVYIVAIDPVTGKLCDQCSFTLRERSEPVGTCKAGIQNPLVKGDQLRIVNGKLNTNMRGQDDTGADVCTATWKIFGESDETSAQWTGLRFRESPMPVPMDNTIWDRNGDGIGDSVVVKFNYSLLNTSKGDSLLPFLLEINWDGTPVYFHRPDYTPEQLKNSDYVRSLYKNQSYLAENRRYWNNFLKDGVTIVIANNDTKFSEKIKTSGTGKVTAWIPYINTECAAVNCSVDNAFTYSGFQSDLKDRIPPIVVKAEYVPGANSKETFTVYLSEPIFAGPDATAEMARDPFAYCLGHSRGPNSCPTTKISADQRQSQSFDNTNWDWEHPNSESYAYSATYRPNTKGPSPTKGDSIVELIYYAGSATRSPKADDWVKLRNNAMVFQDAEGNTFNPRERGVLITGVEKKYGCRIQ